MSEQITLREARREDVGAIVALLADDELGAGREVVREPPAPAYLAAFERVEADPRNLLAVAVDGAGAVVGTLQMTFIPGLSNQGAALALIAAVRVASGLRGQGVGQRMIEWALAQARARGCAHIELMSHASRTDAQRFYERLGFVRSHVGMKRSL
jgi:GNAT superfamily N-acetyltransferase